MILIVCLIIISLPFLVYCMRFLARTSRFQLFGNYFRSVRKDQKVVAITFDDGPSPRVTWRLLDLLRLHNIKCTFFLLGREIENYPYTTQLIVQEGHEIGNHSYSHTRMVNKRLSFIKDEIKRTDELIRQAGYSKEIFFRAPYAAKLIKLPYVLESMRKVHILWNLDSRDWAISDPDLICRNVLEQVRPGAIILMHELPHTTQALEMIIKGLIEKGYKICTVGELIAGKQASI